MIRFLLFSLLLMGCAGCATPHIHLFGVYYIDKEGKVTEKATTRPAETRPADKTVEEIVTEYLL